RKLDGVFSAAEAAPLTDEGIPFVLLLSGLGNCTGRLTELNDDRVAETPGSYRATTPVVAHQLSQSPHQPGSGARTRSQQVWNPGIGGRRHGVRGSGNMYK